MSAPFTLVTMTSRLQILELADTGDHRGSSFTIPTPAIEFVGAIRDLHLAEILPGTIRGNHYHLRRMEAIIVYYQDAWTFHWDEGSPESSSSEAQAGAPPPQQRDFTGVGAAVILVTPGCSHAVANRGHHSITILGISSEAYDPTESVARKLV